MEVSGVQISKSSTNKNHNYLLVTGKILYIDTVM